jgi:hypothetical protein
MRKLLIDFSHCVAPQTRKIIGDRECERIIVDHLIHKKNFGTEIREVFALQLNLFK